MWFHMGIQFAKNQSTKIAAIDKEKVKMGTRVFQLKTLGLIGEKIMPRTRVYRSQQLMRKVN